jgi:hypothetical protein
MKLQKIGALGSFVSAFFMLGCVFSSIDMSFDPTKGFDTISASSNSFMFVYLGLILGAMGEIAFVSALRERMQEGAPNLMGVAVIGLSITCALWIAGALIGIVGMPSVITAEDASAYRAVGRVIISLLTGGDFAAGWVLLVIGLAALNTRSLPLILSLLSIIKGLDMIFSFLVESLVYIGMLLGLVFYTWLGIVLLRKNVEHRLFF